MTKETRETLLDLALLPIKIAMIGMLLVCAILHYMIMPRNKIAPHAIEHDNKPKTKLRLVD